MLEGTGYIPVVNGYRVWFRMVGGGSEHEATPLPVLHGGPGCPHDYLENLTSLASDQRRVIFYDQPGCGNSDLPDDTSLWTEERLRSSKKGNNMLVSRDRRMDNSGVWPVHGLEQSL